MPERIPDTAQDFFNAMRAEFLEMLRQIKSQQEQYFLEIIDILTNPAAVPEPEIDMPDWKPGMILESPSEQPIVAVENELSFDLSQESITRPTEKIRKTPAEIAHESHNDGKGFRMSCDYCREEKYSVNRNK